MSDNKGNSRHETDGSGKGAEGLRTDDSMEESGRRALKTHIRKIARPVLMLATAMIALVIISYTGLRLLLPEDSNINSAISREEQQDILENGHTELIDAERIAFFTSTLNLSTKEAERFWPVYNEFTDKRDKIRKERNDIMERAGQYRGKEGAPEEWSDRLISLEMEEAVLKAEYHIKYKQVLSPRRVIMIYYAEESFKDYMTGRLRGRLSGGQ
ncbi:MAG: hypothetical protein U5K32_01405 [Bacteroidales bacterium]|nr:hypothetical protein [Bacteroidales bacterium]